MHAAKRKLVKLALFNFFCVALVLCRSKNVVALVGKLVSRIPFTGLCVFDALFNPPQLILVFDWVYCCATLLCMLKPVCE